RVELPALLPSSACEPLDQEHVGIADHVPIDPGGPEIEGGDRKVVEQVLESPVAVAGLAQVVRVEGDVAEDALQLGSILVFYLLQRGVDVPADVRLLPFAVDEVEG